MAKMVAFATFELTSSRYINECQVCNVKTSDIMNKGLLLPTLTYVGKHVARQIFLYEILL